MIIKFQLKVQSIKMVVDKLSTVLLVEGGGIFVDLLNLSYQFQRGQQLLGWELITEDLTGLFHPFLSFFAEILQLNERRQVFSHNPSNVLSHFFL
jgi:hypothetical protein